MKKNNKGFTLIELLAVIVVLAIIMVIATQQINGTLRKSRADSLVSSLNMVVKQTKSTYVQYDESMTVENIEENVDFNKSEYTISLDKANGQVCLTTVAGGKFGSVKVDDINGDGISKNKVNSSSDTPIRICKKYK